MAKWKLAPWRIAVAIALTVTFLTLILAAWRCISPPRHRYRALEYEEVGPVLRSFTGRRLPGEVQDLQAILFDDTLYSRESLPALYLAFQTNEQGCSYVLNEFRGPNVRIELFSEQPLGTDRWLWNFGRFFNGCVYQNELGMMLFDMDLLRDIQQAQVVNAQFPEAVYYLQCSSYGVLVLPDRGTVYLYAWKRRGPPQGNPTPMFPPPPSRAK